jgi:hypothetical protein
MAQYRPAYMQLLKVHIIARIVVFFIAAIFLASVIIAAIAGQHLPAAFYRAALALWLSVALIVLGTWILSRFVRKTPHA